MWSSEHLIIVEDVILLLTLAPSNPQNVTTNDPLGVGYSILGKQFVLILFVQLIIRLLVVLRSILNLIAFQLF